MTRSDVLLLITAGVVFGAVAVMAVLYVRDLRKEEALQEALQEASNDAIDRLEDENVSLANFLRYERSETEKWQVQARGRARWSFAASLVAMSVGLGLLSLGVYHAIYDADPVTKVVVAALTAVGATLSSYISHTFMKTQKQIEDRLPLYYYHPATAHYLWSAALLAQEVAPDASKHDIFKPIIGEFLAAARNGNKSLRAKKPRRRRARKEGSKTDSSS
jgi:hypothetical protein